MAKNNIAKLRNLIREDEIVVIQPGSNMLYLIDFTEEVMERPILLFVTKDEEFILAPKMYEEQLSQLRLPIITYLDGEDPYEKIHLKTGLKLLVDETLHSRFLIKLIHKLKPSSIDLVSDTMKKLRMRKDEEEILRIESAVKLAENVFEEFINRIKEGMTEIQLSIELRKIMIELGIEPSFDPITTSAENTSIPHLRNTNRKIHKGDIIIIDYGVKYKGYCSDITRTLSLGPPSDAFALKIFEIVRNAKDLVEDNLVEGIKGFEADKVARDYITSKGYGDKFIHRTGHGIGIDVHEPPFLSPDYNEKLENRMVFTVEPGIYFPGRFGIRLEDMVILNGRGIVLNKKQDEIIIV